MDTKSPLHDITRNAGATYSDEMGYEMPLHYGDATGEYWTARRDAGILDISHVTKIELTGADRASFLHNLCTNDIAKLLPGVGCEAFITTTQAKIVARILAFAGEDSLWIDADPGLDQKIIAHLDKYLITEDVTIHDRTSEWAQVFITGPRCGPILAQHATENAGRLENLNWVTLTLAQVECQIRRNDAFLQPGYDILCRCEDATAIWAALMEEGARPIGGEAAQILSIEAGLPTYGIDIDEAMLPQEVGRDAQAISFTKGCYLGQETVARILAYGHVNRKLVLLRLGGTEPARREEKVVLNGKEIGTITSSAFSPGENQALALAVVRKEAFAPGTELTCSDGRKGTVSSPLQKKLD